VVAVLSENLVDQVTRYLDLAGVGACAVLGGAVARAEGLDLFGFLAVGIVSGLGGGLLRDTLLQHGTPVALTEYTYLVTAIGASLLAFVVTISEAGWARLFTVLDAAVISFWGVSGAQKTLAVGLGWLPAVLLGITTAVGGGATRDVILRRVPSILGGNGLYATVAAIVAGVMVACSYLGVPGIGIVLGVAAGFALRLLAVHYDWKLPTGLTFSRFPRMGSALRIETPEEKRARQDGEQGQ
jgi:uncharacterized membrane protein YeiH